MATQPVVAPGSTASLDRLPEKMTDRGHALVIDSGWREIAATALNFIQRFVH